MQNFNNKCFDFQQQFIDLFNNEVKIPFLLKYYLIEEVWSNIALTKNKIYQENLQGIKQKEFTTSLQEEKEDNKKEK